MEIKLRKYQENLKNKTRKAFLNNKRVIMLAPCGSGKTVISSSILSDAVKKGKKVWFVIHRQELKFQALKTLENFGVDIPVYMIQTLVNQIKKENITETPDMIVLDECFVQGTLIDGKPIEKIQIGDYVTSYNHHTNNIELKRVLNIFKKKPNKLLKIKLSNGEDIICTPNHPFYTDNGYIEAVNLKEKDELYFLWEENNRRKNKGINKRSKRTLQKNRKMVLFTRLYEKVCCQATFRKNERIKSKSRIQEKMQRKNENKQPYAHAWRKRKNDRKFERNNTAKKNTRGKMVQISRRKWKRVHNSTVDFKRCINKIQSRIRICSSNKNKKRQWLSKLLQNRYCFTSIHDSNRSRWRKPQYNKTSRTRQEKRRVIKKVWVESIEIQKPTSDGTFGGMCEGGYVYNLEVKDNNNYFANKILVHNCQHSTSKTYLKLFETYPNTYFLGLSATPCRLSGKPLGDVFESIVSEIEAEELIKMGYLADYDYYAPKLNADFSKVKIKTTGDYDSEEVEKYMDNSTVYGDIIKYYRQLADNKKTIIYCPTINYSLKIEKLFNDNGYKAKHFDGTTNNHERKQIVEDFRDGKINILTNVDLIGERF